jgi:diguanylate cyclase (GGDEF)-like protein/PAS domain S-box-containing protein
MKKIKTFHRKRQSLLTGFMAQLLKTMPLPLGVIDQKGVIKAVNKRFEKLFGYTQQEIPTVKEWAELAYPDAHYREQVLAKWNKAVHQSFEKHLDIEPSTYNVTCKNQQVKIVNISGAIVEDYFLITFIDITDHKITLESLKQYHEEILVQNEKIEAQNFALIKAKESLAESEEKFRAMVEISVDLIFQINTQGIFTYCSPSSYNFMGFYPSEIINQPFSKFVTSDTLAIANSIFVDTLAGKTVRMVVIKAIKKTGEQMWIEVNTSALFKNNKIIGLQGTARDISSRKLAEESLRQQSEIIRYFYDLPFLGMVITSPWDKHLVKFNDQFCNILGYSREELYEKTWLDITHPDDLKENLDKVEQVIRKEIENYTMEKRYIKKDGSIVCVTLNVYCMRGKNKEEDFFVATIQDITDRKIAEKVIQESEERFRTLIEYLQVGVIVQNAQAEIRLNNPKALELLGLNEEQLLGKTSFDPDWNVIHEDGSIFSGNEHPVVQAIAQQQAIKNVIMGVFRPLKNDRVWLLVDAVPQLKEDGSVLQVICTFSDITEHKKSQEQEYKKTVLLNSVINALSDPFYVIDVNNYNIQLANDCAEKWMKKTQTTCYQLSHKRTAPCNGEKHPCPIELVKNSKKLVVLEHIHYNQEGAQQIVEIFAYPIFDKQGNVQQIIEYVIDITERKQTEEKLRQLSQAVEQAPVSIVIANTDGNLQYVNPRFTQVTGYNREEVIGENPRLLKSGLTPPETHVKLWNTIKSGEIWHGELINKRKNGEIYYESAIISPIINEQGIITHFIGIKEDITERKRAEKELQETNQKLKNQLKENQLLRDQLYEQANRDALTGLYNRYYLSGALKREIEKATLEHYPISFMMLDIDFFKKVNDDFGHDAGDFVLKYFAQQLIKQVRATDIICRYGGEEFLIVLPKAFTTEAFQIAERIRTSFAQSKIPIRKNIKIAITVSIGIACFPAQGKDCATVISAADTALLHAKNIGRNRIIISQ